MASNFNNLQSPFFDPASADRTYGRPSTFRSRTPSDFDSLFGTMPATISKLPMYTRGQEGALDTLLGDYLNRPKFDFGAIADQSRSQFQEKTLPHLLHSIGAMGGAGSSGALQMLGSAGAGLDRDLASMQQQYNLQESGQSLQAALQALQPRSETVTEEAYETPGSKLLTIATQLLGLLAGGAGGGAAGGALGQLGALLAKRGGK